MSRCATLLAVSLCCVAQSVSADVAQRRDEALAKYTAQLNELAAGCEQQQLAELAQAARRWAPRRAPLTQYVPLLVDRAPVVDPNASATAREWHERWMQMRRTQAEQWFQLSRAALDEHRPSLAYELLRETVREDPDHSEARRILGYQRLDGRWLTTYEAIRAKSNLVWHAKFGSLPADRVARYEKGERFSKGRWISAADDAREHATIERGWEIPTEHYLIRTNHSLEMGVEVASQLERLYTAWQQLFVLWQINEPQLRRAFDGGKLPEGKTKQHQVVCFRNRDEYNAALAAEHPRISITTGYYDFSKRKAYMFAGLDNISNLYHEASHQLFGELRSSTAPVGVSANFWVVEGVACYMESFVERDGFIEFGGTQAVRLNDARIRLVRDDFYVPLAELVQLGMQTLQRDERIAPIYTQSSGLTYFLIHYDRGRYRDVLVEYLQRIYLGRDKPSTLAELTGVDYATLDRQYAEFIRALSVSAAAQP